MPFNPQLPQAAFVFPGGASGPIQIVKPVPPLMGDVIDLAADDEMSLRRKGFMVGGCGECKMRMKEAKKMMRKAKRAMLGRGRVSILPYEPPPMFTGEGRRRRRRK